MNRIFRTHRIVATVGVLALHAALTSAQEPARAQGAGARGGGGRGVADAAAALRGAVDRLRLSIEEVVRDAPYSGVGLTTTTQVLADGTRIERTGTTRIWRDRQGRVRREQTGVGFDWLNASNDSTPIVTITDPVANVTFTLDPANRTARSSPFSIRRLPPPPPLPPGARSESLGTRDIDGLRTVGSRTSSIIATGQIGNDRPIAVTYERWESPELQILIESRQNDPRTGVVSYRFSNLSRAEPAAELFAIPPDYTVINQAVTPRLLVEPGLAPGGRRGGGARSNAAEPFRSPDGN